MNNGTAEQWLRWASGPSGQPIPGQHPPRTFLSRLKSPPGGYDTETALARISASAEEYARCKHPGTEGHAAWLQAVVLAQRLFNAQHCQGSYGWSITASSDAMYELLPQAFPRERSRPGPAHRPPNTPAREDHQPKGGDLIPERLFPDHAFRTAANRNLQMMRLTMTPAALDSLRETLKNSRLVRHTAFDDTPSPKGTVPAHAATYRGVPIAVHRDLQDQLLTEYTNGSLQYHTLDENHRIVNEPFPRTG